MILQALFAKITKLSLVTLQALAAKVTTTLSSDSSGSLLPKSLQHFPQLQISHATQLQHNTTCRSVVDTYFLTLTTLVRNSIAYAYHMPHTKLSVEVLHPSSALWYFPIYVLSSHKTVSAIQPPSP